MLRYVPGIVRLSVSPDQPIRFVGSDGLLHKHAPPRWHPNPLYATFLAARFSCRLESSHQPAFEHPLQWLAPFHERIYLNPWPSLLLLAALDGPALQPPSLRKF